MTRRDRLVGHYIRAYRMHAVFIVGPPDRGAPAFIGASRNPSVALKTIRFRHGSDLVLRRQWWFADADSAAAVVRECGGSALCALSVEPAITAVLTTARRLGIMVTAHDVVVARAGEAIDRIEAEFQKLRQAGGMKPINRQFKELREQRERQGLKAMRYDDFVFRFKLRMIYRVAASARENGGTAGYKKGDAVGQ
jgi:hypothetical protein